MTEGGGSWLAGDADTPLDAPITLAPDVEQGGEMRHLFARDYPDHVAPVRLHVVPPPDPEVDHEERSRPVLAAPRRDRYGHLPGVISLMLADKASRVRVGVLAVAEQFEAEVARLLPEFSARARSLRLDLEQALAGETPAPVHPWREFNDRGNSCHYPGCELPVDAHPEPAGG